MTRYILDLKAFITVKVDADDLAQAKAWAKKRIELLPVEEWSCPWAPIEGASVDGEIDVVEIDGVPAP